MRGNRSRNAAVRWLRLGTLRRDAREKDKVVSLTMKPPPSLEDWFTLKRYSRRIQRFHFPALRLPGVCSNTLDTIFQPGLFPELFPSLRTLNFDVFNREKFYAQPISLLTPMRLPHLVHLGFTVSEHLQRQDPNEILHLPPTCAPSIRSLVINVTYGGAKQIATPVNLAMNFRGFPYLRVLTLSRDLDISSSDMHELIRLQYLWKLTVTLPNDFDIKDHTSMEPILPSLGYLDIYVDSLNQGTKLLSSTPSSELGCVKIQHHLPASQSDIYALFLEIRRIYKRFPYFDTLVVEWASWTSPITDPSFDLPQSALEPLLACRRLRVFDLISWGKLDVDDAFITQIARAWPTIETFHLRGLQRKISRATLGGLRELLRRCPQLLSLSIEVDARVLPEEEPEMETRSLQMLCITTFGVSSGHPAEKYLRILAPKAQVVELRSVRSDSDWPGPGPEMFFVNYFSYISWDRCPRRSIS